MIIISVFCVFGGGVLSSAPRLVWEEERKGASLPDADLKERKRQGIGGSAL